MDTWKFFDVIHRDHLFCNPLSSEKADQIIEVLDLTPGARVLDIACGKAELTIRVAERYDATGVGVDISPFCIRHARARAAGRVPDGALEFTEADGAAYEAAPGSFDLAICLGASWVFGGHRGTLEALTRAVRPGGLVLVGEPFWRMEPPEEYLRLSETPRGAFDSHEGNMRVGAEVGLVPLYVLASSQDEWDHYEGLHVQAAELYALEHPDDPDVPELVERSRRYRGLYMRFEREVLGEGFYLFLRP